MESVSLRQRVRSGRKRVASFHTQASATASSDGQISSDSLMNTCWIIEGGVVADASVPVGTARGDVSITAMCLNVCFVELQVQRERETGSTFALGWDPTVDFQGGERRLSLPNPPWIPLLLSSIVYSLNLRNYKAAENFSPPPPPPSFSVQIKQ